MNKIYLNAYNTCRIHPKIWEYVNEKMLTETDFDSYELDKYTLNFQEQITKSTNMGFIKSTPNGTGSNALCVNALLDSNQAIALSNISHLYTMENNAPFRNGVQPVILPTKNGKIIVNESKEVINNWNSQFFGSKIKALSITQPTEIGTYYTNTELNQIRELCDNLNLKLQIDGAWLAYCLSNLNTTLNEFIKTMRPDAIYLSGTKTGTPNFDVCLFSKNVDEVKTTSILKQLGLLGTKSWMSGMCFEKLYLGENTLIDEISLKTKQNLDLILNCLQTKKSVKIIERENYSFKLSFEISKENFKHFKNIACFKKELNQTTYLVTFSLTDVDCSDFVNQLKDLD